MVLHIQALLSTVSMLLTMLLWINGVSFSGLMVAVSALVLSVVLIRWASEGFKSATPVSRQGIFWGAFGIGMFVFSYAMVPLYHILCHGSGSIVGGSNPNTLEVNILPMSYRALPVNIKLSKTNISLVANDEKLIYVTLENKAAKSIDAHLTLASQPRTLKPSFGLVVPDEIHLDAWQRTTFPIAIKFKGNIPDDLFQSSLLIFIQDKSDVGQLGKSSAWQKMHGKRYKDGVV